MDENTKKHIQSKLALLPRKPGCYLMKDNTGKVIYVGKAKILKNRVSSYFRGEKTGKTKALVSNISTFEYIVTESEKEAFLLEINLIKKYDPKYNIIFRDDKSYPYIALTTIPYPKLDIVRPRHKRVKKDVKLFGPYPSSYAARSIVNMLNRIYPLRKCKTFPDKPCLYYHIGECLGYCTKNVDKEKCEEMVKEITSFLNGNYNDIVIKLKKDMYDASEKLNFEKAGEIKELLDYIDKVLEKQKIDLTDNVNRDIFNAYEYKGYISMQVFHSRSGRLVERNSYIYEQNEEKEEAIMSQNNIVCASCGQKLTTTSKFCPECGKKYNPCAKCGADLLDDATVCPVCGAKVPKVCPQCKTLIMDDSKFCPECGYSLIKVCKKCGVQLSDTVKFCPECGTVVEDD